MSFNVIEGDVTLRKSTGTETGTATDPLRTDPTGTTAQPITDNGGSLTVDDGGGSITVDGPLTDAQLRAAAVPVSAASLPLPAGAATEATLSALNVNAADIETLITTLNSLVTAIRDTAGIKKITDQLPAGTNNIGDVDVVSSALPTGAATEATLATHLTTTAFQARINTLGQKTMANSTPLVIASDQSVIPVSDNGGSFTVDGTVIADQGAASAATAPWAQRLSDGAAFYKTNTDAQLPTALSGLGNLKTTVSEALPAGTQRLGSVRLVDANDLRLDMAPAATLPSGYRGFLAMGYDEDDKARVLDVRIDPIDGQRRLQIEGKVSLTAPVPPPLTTAVSITFSGALSIGSNQTDDYVIANGKRFVVQQIEAGCEGDTSERGSVVEVYYFNGTTESIIERVYINGFTTEIYPNTSTSRNGTALDGNGTTKTIRVRRRRLSGSSQEVDFIVRGYEYTP